MKKLIAFDMDGTLLDGRLVFALSEKYGLEDKVRQIQGCDLPGYMQTEKIARLFQGLSKKDIESAIESVPLSRNCQSTVQSLKDNGFITGIISDSYTVATEFIARRLGLDFVSANNIEIKNGKLTGNVEMPLGWQFIDCFCKISVCKRFHLEKSAREFDVEMKNTVAIGDTKSDICMIQKAGVGIAYMPKDDYISKSTPNLVLSPDFANILKYVTI